MTVRSAVLCMSIALMAACAAKDPAPAPPDATPVASREMQCYQSERQWVETLVRLRDKGIPEDELLAQTDRIGRTEESRGLMRSRVNDVYLDPKLDAFTLGVYRVAKCLDEVSSDDWPASRGSVSSALMSCQAQGNGTAPSISPCIVDLIDAAQAGKLPGSPVPLE